MALSASVLGDAEPASDQQGCARRQVRGGRTGASKGSTPWVTPGRKRDFCSDEERFRKRLHSALDSLCNSGQIGKRKNRAPTQTGTVYRDSHVKVSLTSIS